MAIYMGLDSSTQSLTAVVIRVDGENREVLDQRSIRFDEDLASYGCQNGVLAHTDPLVAHSNPLMWAEALDRLFDVLSREGNFPLGEIQAIVSRPGLLRRQCGRRGPGEVPDAQSMGVDSMVDAANPCRAFAQRAGPVSGGQHHHATAVGLGCNVGWSQRVRYDRFGQHSGHRGSCRGSEGIGVADGVVLAPNCDRGQPLCAHGTRFQEQAGLEGGHGVGVRPEWRHRVGIQLDGQHIAS